MTLSARRGRRSVLIVDDNPDHLEFLRAAVDSRYDVVTTAHGLDAYELACRTRPDVILLDLLMPVVDGQTVVRKLRSNPLTAGMSIIAVTGLESEMLAALPERQDFAAIVRKPCHQAEIIDAIERVLAVRPRQTSSAS